MSHRNQRRRLLRIILFSVAAWAFAALGRGRSTAEAERSASAAVRPEPRLSDVPGRASGPARPAGRAGRSRAPRPRRRLAVNLVFAALFFAGASLSAVAGDNVAGMLEGDGSETLAVAEATPVPAGSAVVEAEPEAAAAAEPAPAPPAPAQPAPAPEAAAPAPAPAEAAPAESAAPAPVAETPEAAPEAVPADGATPAPAAVAQAGAAFQTTAAARPAPRPRTAPAPALPPTAHVDPEAHQDHVAATVWLHRALPDPTPPSLRLAPETASRLARAAADSKLDWAYLLAVVRADQGVTRTTSASRSLLSRRATLAQKAQRLAYLRVGASRRDAALAFTGDAKAADRAVALARYYRAVGLQTLVDGLLARQDALAEKVLADERVDLYAGGRDDVAAGRVNVRVLALVEYLAESYGQVTVSSLVSGHRLFSRPGVVSMHVYGEAVDIAGLAGLPIAGHQEPGGLTERAVRDILLLPAEMLPRQVISLLGLGGPSFPLADHDDHIHVGF